MYDFLSLFSVVGVTLGAGGGLMVCIVVDLLGDELFEIGSGTFCSSTLPPFFALCIEKTCAQDVLVAETNELRIRNIFTAFFGNFNTVL